MRPKLIVPQLSPKDAALAIKRTLEYEVTDNINEYTKIYKARCKVDNRVFIAAFAETDLPYKLGNIDKEKEIKHKLLLSLFNEVGAYIERTSNG